MLYFVCILVFLVFYSYFVYPESLYIFSSRKFKPPSLPDRKIAVIISIYNEELNIYETLESLLAQLIAFPQAKLYLGDDGSNDNSMKIIESFIQKYPEHIVISSYNRIGKGNVINDIIEKNQLNTDQYHLIFLDGNIQIGDNCIIQLINNLKKPDIGIVGASVYPYQDQDNVESRYILKENRIKSEESRVFGWVVGVFGACFSLRGELFSFIPKSFVTDDLFITFSTVQKGFHAFYSRQIIVYESIQAHVENEFKRKRRYSAGNFQLLFYFWKLLFPSPKRVGFIYCYFFHKIVRWISPILFFFTWIYTIFIHETDLEKTILISGIILFLFLALNLMRLKYKKTFILKRLFYFLMMNLAILFGFLDYIKGIKSNTWERSERN